MRQGGFTYIGLLLLIAIGGIGLAAVGQVWHTESQREREKELLFVGEQYAMAIGSYYESTPGAVKQYPASLQDLLEDRRFPVVRRHLRRLYRDPMTGGAEWGLVRQQGRIVGVHSLSEQRPVKQDGFAEAYSGFIEAKDYRDWKFTTVLGTPALPSSVETAPRQPAETALRTAVADMQPPPVSSQEKTVPNSGQISRYATCQTAMAEEVRQCRAGCGNPASGACQNCGKIAFGNYIACLHAN